MPAIVVAQRFGTDRSIDKGISTLEVASLPLSAASCPTAPAVVPYRFWAELAEPSGPSRRGQSCEELDQHRCQYLGSHHVFLVLCRDVEAAHPVSTHRVRHLRDLVGQR
jgi:hypothetical protein